MDTRHVYDVTEKQKRISEWRDAKRKHLRELYLKDSGHPTKSLLFDTGIYRFGASKTTVNRFYVPTLIDFLIKTAVVITPIIALKLYIDKTKGAEEHRYRTGQVSYADREPKFMG